MAQAGFTDEELDMFEESLKELVEKVEEGAFDEASDIIDGLETESDCSCEKMITSFRSGLLFVISSPHSRVPRRVQMYKEELMFYIDEVIPAVREE